MRLNSRQIVPHIELDHGAHRPIVMRLAGLRFCLSLTEARTLADALHDAAESTLDNTNTNTTEEPEKAQ